MKRREFGGMAVSALALTAMPFSVSADETCQSPYMPMITGHEEYVYIWTLGVEGMGDEQDKMVTVDLRPNSDTRGQVINSVSVGGRNEAHHAGFNSDRRYLWAGGLDTNRIFIFDVHSDPSKPSLHKTIDSFVKDSGGCVGPHTFFALPGRMMITGLSNDEDHGGRTALVEYNDDGEYVATYWMPTADDMQGAVAADGAVADGYGYDVRALIRKNIMLTSSFTGWSNYMMDFGQMLGDAEAMKRFGGTMVQWDLHTRQPKKVFSVPGAPLEVRFPWGPNANYAFSTTALTSKLWLIYEDDAGEWQAKAVADIGNPADIPLPVDISLAADDQTLWINSFMDGTTRLFDVSDPHNPKQIYEKKIASQVNMVSQSWDGERVYYTSSLLGNWDKKGADDAQYLKAYKWNGSELVDDFEIDFYEAQLGRAHLMRFGSAALYS
ncbi:methanethiol oxidase [Sedimentitalea nanhaiensis]|uniref:Selenium-binding protein 1 n=1 Tax=Sedimentitalea nanhaiensis TaxID=999627 RepID=A0A1I7E5S9_9RHOB|nr:selenium-binding protein SBP56-related protein [Sedimentitalea nanhaiensis]SFU19255.1 selenium-binding protein 1 [Sedimentitalea nanhaiensis]